MSGRRKLALHSLEPRSNHTQPQSRLAINPIAQKQPPQLIAIEQSSTKRIKIGIASLYAQDLRTDATHGRGAQLCAPTNGGSKRDRAIRSADLKLG